MRALRLAAPAAALLALLCPPSPARAGLERLATLGWGAGPQEVGRRLADESAPEGPMSLDVDPAGRVLLLDQVNARVLVIGGGKVVEARPLFDDTYQDLARIDDERVALLDRLAGAVVDVVDRRGRILASVPVVGGPVVEAGLVTALAVEPDGLWLELEHARQVRVADLDGRPDPQRPVRAGRLSGDRKERLVAARDGAFLVGLWAQPATRDDAPARQLAVLGFAEPLLQITALDSDARGQVLLGAQTYRDGGAPEHAIVAVDEWLLWVGADGVARSRVALPPRTTALEQFRPLRAMADGRAVYLHLDDGGATLWEVTP